MIDQRANRLGKRIQAGDRCTRDNKKPQLLAPLMSVGAQNIPDISPHQASLGASIASEVRQSPLRPWPSQLRDELQRSRAIFTSLRKGFPHRRELRLALTRVLGVSAVARDTFLGVLDDPPAGALSELRGKLAQDYAQRRA